MIPATFTPFVMHIALDDVPSALALEVHEDTSISVNWPLIEAYAASSPIDRNVLDHGAPGDFLQRCLAHALLALRDGRVKEITQ